MTYAFDYADRPVAATGTIASQNTSYVTAATYLPFGPNTSLTLGNGTVETRTYNNRYLPLTSGLTHGATIAQHAYTNDPAGNVTAIADSTNSGYSRTFGYDDLNRLTTASSGSLLWGSTGSFTYDRMGNMLSTTLGGTSRTFTYQSTKPLINTATDLATSMSYDAAGNELKSPAGVPGSGDPVLYSPRNLVQSQFVRAYDRCVELYGDACIQPDPVEEWRTHVYDGRGVRVISTTESLA